MTKNSVLLVNGHWVGGFASAGQWMFIQLTFVSSQNTITATADLPFNGETGLILEELAVGSTEIHFTLNVAGSKVVFRGQIDGDTIVGQAHKEQTENPFQFVRSAEPSFKLPPKYMGIYKLAPDHDLFIGNMTGSFVSAYHDFKSRRISALFPNSSESYFAGRELLVPFPSDVEIRFLVNEEGTVTGLQWQQQEQLPRTAAKVSIVEEVVEFYNGDVQLAGTIIRPPEPGPYPGVVMVHGSGPQTRHMVRLYADAFARHGIATLIYDKRGVGESTGQWESDYSDLADDALAGVKLLQSHPHIAPNQIGLCGASQAGWIEPIAASRSKDVAFIVLLVSPAVSIARQNLLNVEYSMRASGFSETDIHAAVAHVGLFNHVLCTGEKWSDFQHSLEAGRQSAWIKYAWPLQNPPEPESIADRRARMENDPLPILQQVTCPILAIFGGSDTVVPYKENRALMEEALRKSGHTDFTLHVLPKSTHIFTESETGTDAEFPHTTHWLPEHIKITADWILARSGNGTLS